MITTRTIKTTFKTQSRMYDDKNKTIYG